MMENSHGSVMVPIRRNIRSAVAYIIPTIICTSFHIRALRQTWTTETQLWRSRWLIFGHRSQPLEGQHLHTVPIGRRFRVRNFKWNPSVDHKLSASELQRNSDHIFTLTKSVRLVWILSMSSMLEIDRQRRVRVLCRTAVQRLCCCFW